MIVRCASVCQLTVELVSEGVQQVRDGFLHTDVSLQLSAQWCHSFIFDTTRHDVAEPRHVGVTVQSQTVRGDVSAAVDSYRQNDQHAIRRSSFNPPTTNLAISKEQCTHQTVTDYLLICHFALPSWRLKHIGMFLLFNSLHSWVPILVIFNLFDKQFRTRCSDWETDWNETLRRRNLHCVTVV